MTTGTNPFIGAWKLSENWGLMGWLRSSNRSPEGAYRCVDGRVLAERNAYTVESMLAYIAALPDPESLAAEL